MDAKSHRSSISAGLLIFALLNEDPDVSSMASRIFPVALTSEDIPLPFIVFRAISQGDTQTKPSGGCDTCQIAVDCAGKTYEEAVELAEYARSALEDRECERGGLSLGISYLSDREEFYDSDAYVERLIFTITV